MIARSVGEAIENAALTVRWTPGMCGQFCAAMYGYGFSGYRDAVAQWQATPRGIRHEGDDQAPRGCLMFWGGGSQGHGHVAISAGDGSCYSIDIAGQGTVSRAPANLIHTLWGLPYLGWSMPYFQGQEWTPVGIFGTDVSMYQPINFALELPGSDTQKVDFAIIKVTEGLGWTSARWKGQRQWAEDHDLSVGFYHFARPGNMIAQADRFLETIGLLHPGDHLWFDWEDAGVTSAQKDQWIKYVQSKAVGHRVGLYCNTSFWKGRDATSFAGDGLWIATGDIPAGHPPIESPWLIHQFSTSGDYDHDLAAFASRADMIGWAGGEMALSADDKKWIKDTITAVVKAEVAKAVLTTDNIIPGPADASDHSSNPFWTLSSHVAATTAATRTLATVIPDLVAQSRANGEALSALKIALESLDLDQLPAAVAEKLTHFKVILQEV